MSDRSKNIFAEFAYKKIDSLLADGREGTAATYTSSVRSFMRFLEAENMDLWRMDELLMERYEAWLLRNGVLKNTSSFYLRTLRTICRQAASSGLELWNDDSAFSHVFTGFTKTAKRAITMEDIRGIKALDLTGRPALAFARDMFLFSFYLRGMSFVDMAYLRKSDLHNGMLSYVRRKTHQKLCVEWEPQMQEIIDLYEDKCAGLPYLLPIISRGDIPERGQYQLVQHAVNRNLKKVAELLGMDISLTMYVARHSWASLAYRMNIPVSVISEGMGHESERTTRIYLASLDSAVVDDANRRIISSL